LIEQAGTGGHCPIDSGHIDLAALNSITYGLYVVTARDSERRNGLVVNTVVQVAGEPCQVSVSVNRASLTHELVMTSGAFAVSVLEQDTPLEFIGRFGFRTGRTYDKFERVRFHDGATGCPLLDEYTLAHIEARVRTAVDCGSHTTFIADVVASAKVKPGLPLTYEYYHKVKGGKTGKGAPTYGIDMSKCSTEKKGATG